jgi:hypothetical protein
MSTTGQDPYRVVDRENHGWYQASDGQGGFVYRIDYQTQIPDYATLAAKRGPVRPVLPADEADVAELDRLFALAGRKAVTSLAAAIETVFHNLREAAGGLNNRTSYDFAMRTLKAGRAGSWEAALLEEVVFFGCDLNLDYKAAQKGTPAAMRAAGPSRRVHREARDQMADVVTRWVTNPARYTEIAETLASIVSSYADQVGPAGWRVIADQWLQSPTFGDPGFTACYRLLYSRSEHYDPLLA